MSIIPGLGLLVDGATDTCNGRPPVAKETEAPGERRSSPSRSLTTSDATRSLSWGHIHQTQEKISATFRDLCQKVMYEGIF
jgi:hypothetical protein